MLDIEGRHRRPMAVAKHEAAVDMTAVHRANFSFLPPVSALEGAAEPPGWNADHIRSTWIKNVGR